MGALDFLAKFKQTQVQARSVSLPTGPKSKIPAVAVSELAALPSDYRAKAEERRRFVLSVRTAIAAGKTAAHAAADVAIRDVATYPILRCAGKKGASALTYDNYRAWAAALNPAADPESQLLALADSYARGTRKKSGDPRFWERFFAAYLNLNKLPLPVAYRNSAAWMAREDASAIIPTIAQVRFRVAQLPTKTVILAREGEEALKNTCLDYIERDWSGVHPGDCAIGDSRDFDTRVKIPSAKCGWRGVRPTITGLMDAASWYLVAWWITTEPVNSNTLTNTLALYCHNADNVPPKSCYFDNGKDYNAAGFSTPLVTPDGSEHSIFRALNIDLINSRAYNGRAKTIERFFRDMMQRFDKTWGDYLGSRPGQRTITADYVDAHPEVLPSLGEFCERFAAYIEEYNRTPKNGRIHGGKTPAEIWGARLRREPLAQQSLELAFYRPVAVRQVKRGPAVELSGVRYYCDALQWGDKVLVKTSPFEAGHCQLCRFDGSLIGYGYTRDRIKAIAGDDSAERAKVAEGMARQRRQLREAQTMLNDLTGGLHRVSPGELFLAPGSETLMIATGSRRSVKGSSHNYVHHKLALPFDFVEDEAEEQLEKFSESVAQKERPSEPSEEISRDLEAFHAFTTHKSAEDF